jgi:hypothetical protein
VWRRTTGGCDLQVEDERRRRDVDKVANNGITIWTSRREYIVGSGMREAQEARGRSDRDARKAKLQDDVDVNGSCTTYGGNQSIEDSIKQRQTGSRSVTGFCERLGELGVHTRAAGGGARFTSDSKVDLLSAAARS